MTSRLVIGTPRIPAKPPRRIPCTEVRYTGANVLPDGGFESSFGFGTEGDEIPEAGSGFGEPRGMFSDCSAFPFTVCTPAPLYGWAADTNQVDPIFPDQRWHVSAANPRTGTYHGRYIEESAAVNLLYGVRIDLCGYGPSGVKPRAVKVSPGDVCDFAFWFMVSTLTGGARFSYALTFLDTDGVEMVEHSTNDATPATSYTQYTKSVVAPAGSGYVLPWVTRGNPTGSPADSVTYDTDDWTLGVT